MDSNRFKYELDEIPPFIDLLFLGLQWFAVIVPTVIIVGNIVAGLHFSEPADRIIYIQKVFFITGVSLLIQLLWGTGCRGYGAGDNTPCGITVSGAVV